MLIDGRRSTVSWHGLSGQYVYPGLIMASGDMVAVDTEVPVKILQTYPEKNRLDVPAEELGQIKAAVQHNIGSTRYIVLEAPAKSETEQEGVLRDPALVAMAGQLGETVK